MWEEPKIKKSLKKDLTKELLDLRGELTEEQARATLAEFLYNNPAFLMDLVAGIKMYPFQEIIIKGWMKNDYNMAVWGRGVSKSWTVAIFAIIWAIFNPGNRIVIVSFAFRASRRILEQCEKFINDKDAIFLRSCFPKDLTKGNDEWKWTLPNGSTIQSLPLGDGTKIRGIRADTLIVDEFAYLPETVIGEVLQPFLVANNKIKEQRETQEREDARIAEGIMTEAERTVIEENIKVIFLSSACYQFEHMYTRYNEWIENVRAEKGSKKDTGVSYFVSRIGYEAAPDGLVNKKVIEEAKQTTSEQVFDREYRAIFTPDSSGFYSAKKMQACTIPDGESPCLELVGEKNAEYGISIDPAMSNSENSDDFAMCVWKIVKKKDGRKIPLIVHNYAVSGGDLKDHISYFFFILKHFNIVWIAIDSSQGNSVEFINSANQSRLFKEHKIELIDIDADFKKDDFTDLPKEIKRSYNKQIGRIVQKQPFGSVFQKAANEYMQGCIDFKNILFGGKIAANSEASAAAMDVDISMLQNHKEFKDMTITEFIENQDYLIDLVKKECALIEVKTTVLGSQQFDLPQNLRRSTSINKVRKDSYSALLLATWANKLFNESMTINVEQGAPDFDYILIG